MGSCSPTLPKRLQSIFIIYFDTQIVKDLVNLTREGEGGCFVLHVCFPTGLIIPQIFLDI